MWRRRRDHPPQSYRGTLTAAGPDTARAPASRGRRGSRWRGRWNAWRMDRAHASQVAWANEPELTPRAARANAVPGPSPLPADERLGHDMPRVYCARCGQENPEDARFCSHCGIALARGGGEPGESTSTISLGGSELAEAEPDEPLADSEAGEKLPPGSAPPPGESGPHPGRPFNVPHGPPTSLPHPARDNF